MARVDVYSTKRFGRPLGKYVHEDLRSFAEKYRARVVIEAKKTPRGKRVAGSIGISEGRVDWYVGTSDRIAPSVVFGYTTKKGQYVEGDNFFQKAIAKSRKSSGI